VVKGVLMVEVIEGVLLVEPVEWCIDESLIGIANKFPVLSMQLPSRTVMCGWRNPEQLLATGNRMLCKKKVKKQILMFSFINQYLKLFQIEKIWFSYRRHLVECKKTEYLKLNEHQNRDAFAAVFT
jgi:hypothetical protein